MAEHGVGGSLRVPGDDRTQDLLMLGVSIRRAARVREDRLLRVSLGEFPQLAKDCRHPRPAARVLLAISVAGAVVYLLLGTAANTTTLPAASTSESSSGWDSFGSSSPPSPLPGGPQRPSQNDPIAAVPGDLFARVLRRLFTAG